MPGFATDDSNIAGMMAAAQSQVDISSHMDRFIGKIWQKNPTWLNCYIGTEEALLLPEHFSCSAGLPVSRHRATSTWTSHHSGHHRSGSQSSGQEILA